MKQARTIDTGVQRDLLAVHGCLWKNVNFISVFLFTRTLTFDQTHRRIKNV
jgi:hypothetical protein